MKLFFKNIFPRIRLIGKSLSVRYKAIQFIYQNRLYIQSDVLEITSGEVWRDKLATFYRQNSAMILSVNECLTYRDELSILKPELIEQHRKSSKIFINFMQECVRHQSKGETRIDLEKAISEQQAVIREERRGKPLYC